MRLYEFASAQAQLALWKLISDNVWSAIDQQARDEAKLKATSKKTVRSKRGSINGINPPAPIPRIPQNKFATTIQTAGVNRQSISPQKQAGLQFSANSSEASKTFDQSEQGELDDKAADDGTETGADAISYPKTGQIGRLPVAQKLKPTTHLPVL